MNEIMRLTRNEQHDLQGVIVSASSEEGFRHEGGEQLDLFVALLQIQGSQFHLDRLGVSLGLGELGLEVELDHSGVGRSGSTGSARSAGG